MYDRQNEFNKLMREFMVNQAEINRLQSARIDKLKKWTEWRILTALLVLEIARYTSGAIF